MIHSFLVLLDRENWACCSSKNTGDYGAGKHLVQVTEIGNSIRKKWLSLANAHGLKIVLSGRPALSSFHIECSDMLKYKTLISQEMLKRGFLCSTTVYTCTAHEERVLEDYVSNLDEVFAWIKLCESGSVDIDEILEGAVCHSGFKRLN